MNNESGMGQSSSTHNNFRAKPSTSVIKIELTEVEGQICKIIANHAQSLEPPTTARLAGGWIRDKIMGIQSHDMDVTLDNISGYAFAMGLSEKYHSASIQQGLNINAKALVSTAHKIQANPDKSKHLETAVVSILGIAVDFTHLRNEKYTTTRIPTIVPGTPLEDALRRDLTINALFYNLSTREIEDFTGKGLEDIENKLIRTPLDSFIILFEDPLRILRIFRFMAKFQFRIDESIYEALKSQEIYDALEKKVSRENRYRNIQDAGV